MASSPATFTIGGTLITTEKYAIEVQDNIMPADGPDVPHDEIIVGCSPFVGAAAVCAPNTVNGMENILWGFSIGFGAPATVLEGADIPGDSAIWNAFERGLFMSLREKNGPGIIRLRASVGPFLAVPEPQVFASFVLGILSIVAFVGRLRRIEPAFDETNWHHASGLIFRTTNAVFRGLC